MPTQSSRRRPWPWDARLSISPIGIPDNGLMLVPNPQTGLMIGKKQQNLSQSYPPVADYGSSPTYRERTFEFRPTGGFGESIQSSGQDHRYHYAMDMWVTGGLFGQGPLVHDLTPPVTGRIRLFVEALGPAAGRALSLFALAGANVLLRSDDTAAGMGALHTRAGHVAMDAVRYAGLFSGAPDALYVAWDDGVLEEYNGTAWTPCVLPAGFAPQFLCRLGDELWAADPVTCQIRKCTNDPKVAGSWSGPIQIGTPSIRITALRQTNDQLVIAKADGDLFTVNADGSDNDLYPGLANTTDPDNCRTMVAWQGSLWFRTGRAFWKLDVQGGYTLSPQGPGRNLSNLSEVRGPVQAFAGWNSQMAFGAIYNSQLNNSYLLTYGNWEPSQTGTGTQFTFADQWDGAIAHWVGRKVTALFVSSVPSDARLYIGFEDGGYSWIKLVPFPLIPNGGAEFNTGGYIVLPLHHAMFQADLKHFIGVSVFGPYFPSDGAVNISYRLRGSAGMPPATPDDDFITTDIAPFNTNGQRNDFSTPVSGAAIEVKLSMTSANPADTPILEGIGWHEQLVPAFRRDFQFTVDCRDYVARRDGAAERHSGRWLRDLIIQAASQPANVVLELPDETVQDVAFFDYTERQVVHTAFGGQAWQVDCQVTQFGLKSIYGTIGRTRGTQIGATRGFTIDRMRLM